MITKTLEKGLSISILLIVDSSLTWTLFISSTIGPRSLLVICSWSRRDTQRWETTCIAIPSCTTTPSSPPASGRRLSLPPLIRHSSCVTVCLCATAGITSEDRPCVLWSVPPQEMRPGSGTGTGLRVVMFKRYCVIWTVRCVNVVISLQVWIGKIGKII